MRSIWKGHERSKKIRKQRGGRMKDIEIVVFNDKSWVRLKEYQKVKEENKILKDREEGFKKQIIGLCEKYHQVYERFPELKDAFLQGDRIILENEQLKQQIQLYKEMLNRNPCVRIPDWHCSDCLEENTKLKQQNEKMKNCHNCRHGYHDRYHTFQCIRNCINLDKWELAE